MTPIRIYTSPEFIHTLKAIIESEDRLNELVELIACQANESFASGSISLFNQTISLIPCWLNEAPPLLLEADWSFSKEALLALVFTKLGNFEKAYDLLQNHPEKLQWVDQINRLQHHLPLLETSVENATAKGHHSLHNWCICAHYGSGNSNFSFENSCNCYEQALLLATEPETKAFTAYHYASFLADMGMGTDAEKIINQQLEDLHLPEGRYAFQSLLCSIWLEQMQVPYNLQKLETLKKLMLQNLHYLEQQQLNIPLALLWIDAAHVANISESFAESLGYITKSIQLLEKEEQPELLAQAQLKKGILLYTWSQNGQPQFLKGAMDALLAALRVFTREAAPDVFADIHHYLGIIYSEIPDETKKKSLWAAVSVSSFQEALQYYNKVDFPYEFAMICHHQGNAYMKYPAALHSDNYDKALAWFREALDIRTADHYPIERCNTLSNYLQAAWLVGNNSKELPEERWNDIREKATELLHLTTDESLRSEAAEQLEQLETVRNNWNPIQHA